MTLHLQAFEQHVEAAKLAGKASKDANAQQASGSWVSRFANGVNIWINGK